MVSRLLGGDLQLRPCRDGEPGCAYVFLVNSNLLPQLSDAVSVIYNGTGYAVPDYPHGGGYSLTSLEMTKQLLALFSSAKSLPQTNVLSVVNQ
jgi:hypothetical protein